MNTEIYDHSQQILWKSCLTFLQNGASFTTHLSLYDPFHTASNRVLVVEFQV